MAERRADLVVTEQVAQHVGRNAFVSVPLGVAVPVGVGNHREPVEDLFPRRAICAGHRGDEQVGDRVHPLPVGAGEGRLAVGDRPARVGPVAGEQRQDPGRGGGEAGTDVGLLADDDAGGGLGDRQPPAGPVVLGIGVDQHRLAVGVAGQAVQPQLADLVGPPAGVHHQLSHSAHVGAAAFFQDVQVGVEDLKHPGGQVPALLVGVRLGGDVLAAHDEVVGKPSATPPGRVRPMARMSVRKRRASRQARTRILTEIVPVRSR